MSKWTWEEHADARSGAYCNDSVEPLGPVIGFAAWVNADEGDRECMREQLIAEAWGLA